MQCTLVTVASNPSASRSKIRALARVASAGMMKRRASWVNSARA